MSQDLQTYDDQWAAQAKSAQSEEPVSGGEFISLAGGQMRIGDEVMPGNQCIVIVVDSIRENVYYDVDYDPDNPLPPRCYAMSRDGVGMYPHEAMQSHPYFEPQHIVEGEVFGCDGCPQAEWGSAKRGRGKACKNKRRLSLLPAGYVEDGSVQLFDEPNHFASADPATLKLPVMSVKNWAHYVSKLAQTVNRPPHGAFTRIYLQPDPKSQFTVQFEMVDIVPDALAATLMQRHESAQAQPLPTYDAPADD